MSNHKLMGDADSINLLQRFIKICEEENNQAIAVLLNQLINTIAEIGIDNVKPFRPIESEVVKSIESDKTYWISTVHMNGHGVKEDWFETAVFLSDEEGEVECWMPVYSDGHKNLDEAKFERARVKIKVQSGIFDKINPWEI
jgi:hypothetical protein